MQTNMTEPMNPSLQFCPNMTCSARGQIGQKHGETVHHDLIEQGKLDLVHVQADEIRVKGRSMIAWMGLCAVSVHMKFLRYAGEGESETSRTPNLPDVETPKEKEHVGKAEDFRRYV